MNVSQRKKVRNLISAVLLTTEDLHQGEGDADLKLIRWDSASFLQPLVGYHVLWGCFIGKNDSKMEFVFRLRR